MLKKATLFFTAVGKLNVERFREQNADLVEPGLFLRRELWAGGRGLHPQDSSVQGTARFDQPSRCWLLANWFVLGGHGFRMVAQTVYTAKRFLFYFLLEVLFQLSDFITVFFTGSKTILR